MKPLARWTIGKVSKTGHEILKESIISFKKIYPEFDYTVCYNEIELEDLETLENVSYFQQNTIVAIFKSSLFLLTLGSFFLLD